MKTPVQDFLQDVLIDADEGRPARLLRSDPAGPSRLLGMLAVVATALASTGAQAQSQTQPVVEAIRGAQSVVYTAGDINRAGQSIETAQRIGGVSGALYGLDRLLSLGSRVARTAEPFLSKDPAVAASAPTAAAGAAPGGAYASQDAFLEDFGIKP